MVLGSRIHGILYVGDWRVDRGARTITNGVIVRRLSPRAIRLLDVLIDARGDVASRDILLDRIWPDVVVSDESLTQAVAELRRAFRIPGKSGETIETIAKSGYRLTAPVLLDVQDDDRQPLSAASDAFDVTAYRLCLESRVVLTRSGRGAIEMAEDLAREAAERAGRFAYAQSNFAIMLTQRHLYLSDGRSRLAEALKRSERAIQLRPDAAASYTARLHVLGALEQWSAAETNLGLALRCDQDDPDAHYYAARNMFASRDFRSAAALAERAAQLNVGDYRALFLAARAARVFDAERGRRNAEEAFQRVQARLVCDPQEPRALNALGPLLALLGHREQSIAAFEADEARGSNVEFYNAVARAYVGDRSGAVAALEQVAENGWNHPAWLMAEPAIADLSEDRRFKRVSRAIRQH